MGSLNKYILVDKKPVLCPDLMTWALWFETADRQVAHSLLPNGVGVSTIFLGLDQRVFVMHKDGPPIIFETMIFGGEYDLCKYQCCTWEQAERQHQKAIELCLEIQYN